MKAVMVEVPQHLLDERMRSGVDQWDEMWEGILHMNPPPEPDHQDLEYDLESWLRACWATRGNHLVRHQVALSPNDESNWTNNYRTPDLVLVSRDRFHIIRKKYYHGAPDVAVEIRSPGDETYEKFTFYATLKIPELWVIDRDTKAAEMWVLHGDEYRRQAANAANWVISRATGVQLRQAAEGKLELCLDGDETTRRTFSAAQTDSV
jgi:Uma2 family endonuclease